MHKDVFELNSKQVGFSFSAALSNKEFNLTPLKRFIDYLIVNNHQQRNTLIPESTHSKILQDNFNQDLQAALANLHESYGRFLDKTLYIFPITVQDFLNENYSLNDQQRNYLIDFSSNTSLLTFNVLSNYQLELIFTTKVFNSYDKYAYLQNLLYKEQEAHGLRLLSDVSSEEICHVSFVMNLNFENHKLSKNQTILYPFVELKLEISSNYPKFRYIGRYVEDEIIEINNIGSLDCYRKPRYSYYQQDTSNTSIIDNVISKNMMLIGSSIETILLSIEQQNYQELFSIFYNMQLLLDHVIRNVLLMENVKNGYEILLNYQKLIINLGTLKNFACELIYSVKNEKNNPGAIFHAHNELIEIFKNMNEHKFNRAIVAFFDPMLVQVQELSNLIYNNPNKFLKDHSQKLDARIYEYNLQDLSKLSYILSISIMLIKSAIASVSAERRLTVLGIKNPSPGKNTKKILESVENYFLNLCLNPQHFVHAHELSNQILWNIESKYLPPIDTLNFNCSLNNHIPKEEHAITVDNSESKALLYYSFIHSRKRLSCCPLRYSAEQIAALWGRNPAIKGINDGLVIYFAAKQLLSLYPNVRNSISPYLTLINVAAGGVGILIGRNAILYPNQPVNKLVKVWESATDGLLILIFNLGVAINTYLLIHPQNHNVSNLVFWGQIAPIPIVLSIAYTVWYSLQNANSIKSNYLNKIIDFFGKTLLFGGALGISSLKSSARIKASFYQYYILGTAIAGMSFALIQYTSFKERINLVAIYLTASNLMYMLIEEIVNNHSEDNNLANIFNYLQIGFWSGALVWSVYFIAKNAVVFIKANPTVIIGQAPDNNEHADNFQSQPLLNVTNYRAIEELVDEVELLNKSLYRPPSPNYSPNYSPNGSPNYSPMHSPDNSRSNSPVFFSQYNKSPSSVTLSRIGSDPALLELGIKKDPLYTATEARSGRFRSPPKQRLPL